MKKLPFLNKNILIATLLLSCSLSPTTQAFDKVGKFDTTEIAYALNTDENDIRLQGYEACGSYNILEISTCFAAAEFIRKKLADKNVQFRLYHGDMILRKDLPWKKLGGKKDFRYGYVKLYLSGDIDLNEEYIGHDPHYSTMITFHVNAKVKGDGTVRKHRDYIGDKDYDVDIWGNADFTATLGIALNPQSIKTTEGHKLILQPKIRILQIGDISGNIDYDIDSNGSLLGNIFDLAIDYTSGMASIFDDLTRLDINGAINGSIDTILPLLINIDDLSNDLLFRTASRHTNYHLLDPFLDEQKRVLYDQEQDLNDQFLNALGADENGMIVFEYPDSVGVGTAQLVAINYIL